MILTSFITLLRTLRFEFVELSRRISHTLPLSNSHWKDNNDVEPKFVEEVAKGERFENITDKEGVAPCIQDCLRESNLSTSRDVISQNWTLHD